MGDGVWIIIDSCIDRGSGRPVALEYLKSLHVDVASQVKLVVATHWHDDHIRGLAEILREAESASFVNSAAYVFCDLVRMVKLGSNTAPVSNATTEYAGILQLLELRRKKGETRASVGPIQAVANRNLLTLNGAGRSVDAEVIALSPGDGVLHLAHAELTHALWSVRNQRRPPQQGPNQLCVVLWLRVGELNALLGADLEHLPRTTEGWRAIIGSAGRPKGRAVFFKVPHHGSSNADCPECWTEMLSEYPIAVLTPHSPSKLPRPGDITRLCGQASQVFLTAGPTQYRTPRRDNAVEKTLREMGAKPRALAGHMGHVCLRADAVDATQRPFVELHNGARQLCV
jgi:hypothetical protein